MAGLLEFPGTHALQQLVKLLDLGIPAMGPVVDDLGEHRHGGLAAFEQLLSLQAAFPTEDGAQGVGTCSTPLGRFPSRVRDGSPS
jgi:hypothetical protein